MFQNLIIIILSYSIASKPLYSGVLPVLFGCCSVNTPFYRTSIEGDPKDNRTKPCPNLCFLLLKHQVFTCGFYKKKMLFEAGIGGSNVRVKVFFEVLVLNNVCSFLARAHCCGARLFYYRSKKQAGTYVKIDVRF